MKDVTRNIPAAPLDRALAQVLKAAYTEEGLTQQKLIEATGISETTMGRLFRGESAWSMSQVYAVSDAIGGPDTAEQLMARARKRAAEAAMSEDADSNVLRFNPRTAPAGALDSNGAGEARAAHALDDEGGDQPDN